jgi:HK97 family phage prohead protease
MNLKLEGRMSESPPMEYRAIAQPVTLRGTGSRRIGGGAATFRSPSENLGGFIEKIDPRFFAKSRGDGFPGVLCRFQHSDQAILGSTQAGTLRLDIDQSGLNYEVDVPQSREDVIELVGRGDVAHSSIAFETWEDDWTTDSGTAVRTLLSGRLIDTAPVTNPAYKDTTTALRSLADYANADPADVLTLAEQGELRKLLSRSDRRSDRVPTYPGAGHRCPRSGRQALLDTLALRWPEEPPEPRSGRQALLDTLALRWPEEPHEPKSGALAWIETMGRRWPE